MDATQQERLFDDTIDDILLMAEQFKWSAIKLEEELRDAAIPDELVSSVLTYYK